MKNLSFLLISAALFSASCNAQNSGSYTPLSGGMEYMVVQKGSSNQKGNPGDVAQLHVMMKINDSVMMSTRDLENGNPVPQPLSEPQTKGDLMEGLLLMNVGDSFVFRMDFDTLSAMTQQPAPEWVGPNSYAYWHIKMVDIKTQEEIQKEEAELTAKQRGIDEQTILDYFKEKNITNYKKTESGLYYVITKPGTGDSPQNGQKMTMNYTGMLLNGEKFDSNVDPAFNHVQPFEFNLGQGMVIKGWDEGIALLNKGAKATLYIPSHLGYGSRGAGDRIPGNSVLIFDVELVNFE